MVTGTLVGLGEAQPLNLRGAPALSRICWRSHLLSLSSFPESLDTHPVFCKRFHAIFSHTIANFRTQSYVPQGFSTVWGMMHFRTSCMKCSENARARVSLPSSRVSCWGGESLKRLLGCLGVTSTPTPRAAGG